MLAEALGQSAKMLAWRARSVRGLPEWTNSSNGHADRGLGRASVETHRAPPPVPESPMVSQEASRGWSRCPPCSPRGTKPSLTPWPTRTATGPAWCYANNRLSDSVAKRTVGKAGGSCERNTGGAVGDAGSSAMDFERASRRRCTRVQPGRRPPACLALPAPGRVASPGEATYASRRASGHGHG